MDGFWEVKDVLVAAWSQILTAFLAWLPRALAAVVLVVAGAALAKLIEWIVRGLLVKARFDAAMDRVGVKKALGQLRFEGNLARLLARASYWIVVLIFLQAAVATLRLPVLSDAIARALEYAPSLFSAVLVFAVGMFLANFLSALAGRAAEPLGRWQSVAITRIVSVFVLAVMGTIAVAQLRIETQVLQALLLTVVIGVGLGMALTFGLGSREITRSMLAGFYARKLFHSGDEVEISGEKGTLVTITPTQTVLEQRGRLKAIPNDVYLSSVVEKQVPKAES